MVAAVFGDPSMKSVEVASTNPGELQRTAEQFAPGDASIGSTTPRPLSRAGGGCDAPPHVW